MTHTGCPRCRIPTQHTGPFFLPTTLDMYVLHGHYQCQRCGGVHIPTAKNLKGEKTIFSYVDLHLVSRWQAARALAFGGTS